MDYLIYIYLVLVLSLTVSPTLVCFLAVLALGIIAIVYDSKKKGKGECNSKIAIDPTLKPNSTIKVFAICFSIVLSGTMAYWLSYYPGGLNLDALGQWEQAHGLMELNDWHPLMSTIIIKLSTKICDSFAFCILLQVLMFSIATALLLSTLSQNGTPTIISVAIAIYIAINPAIGLNTISLTKDAQFTILAVLMTDALIRIHYTEGKWLLSVCRCQYLAFITALICLVRHNGILLAFPAIALALMLNRSAARRLIYTAVISALCILAVKVPIAAALRVAPHEDPVGEAMGIPMAIMANALVTNPDSIPDDVHDFLNCIADDASWKEQYCLGEWDSCKWAFPNAAIVKETKPSQLLGYTLKTIGACPEAAYASIRANTNIVWQPITMKDYWIPEVYIQDNEHGITMNPVKPFPSITSALIELSQLPLLSTICWNTGAQIIVILAAFLLTGRERYNSAAFLYVPLLVYDMGTMLLLAGPNQRYFYCNAVLFLPIAAAALIRRGVVCQS